MCTHSFNPFKENLPDKNRNLEPHINDERKVIRTTKVEHKAPGMCGQVYVLLRICVDRPTYRQSKISKDEI